MQIEVVEIARRLIRIPSASRYESRLADEIEDILRPIEVRRQRVGDIGFNLISEYRGSENSPTIVLNGHMDTVEPVKSWSRDPYSPDIEGGKLYGLGSADMKGGLSAIIWAYRRAVKEKLPVNLIFTAVVDEEINSQGAYELLKEIKGDIALIAEPTGEKMMLGARGRYVLDMAVKGRSSHGARPYKGVNSIECGAEIIKALKSMKIPEKNGMKGSVAPLKIEGGGDFLSVPESCLIVIDRHVIPGESRELVMDGFKNLIENLNLPCEVEISWHSRPTPFLEPYSFSPDEGLIRDFASLYIEKYGELRTICGESVGDYNLFAKYMPTVVYGPKGENWHSADEFVYTDSLERVASFYYEFIRKVGDIHERKDP